MFENNQAEIEKIMARNSEFRVLYYRHCELNKQVHDAEIGVLPIDDATLVRMKKEKLWTKDKLMRMYEAETS